MDIKTVQTLARHTDPRITMNPCAKARRENLFRAAEIIGRTAILPDASTLIAYDPTEPSQEVPDVAPVTA